MKRLFEAWRETNEESRDPKVSCHCLCLDCVFNKNEYCVAENIELDYAETEDGRTICECKTYEVDSNRDEDRATGQTLASTATRLKAYKTLYRKDRA